MFNTIIITSETELFVLYIYNVQNCIYLRKLCDSLIIGAIWIKYLKNLR